MHGRALMTGLVLSVGTALAGATPAALAAEAASPPEDSPTIQSVRERGALRVGILAGYPWLQENTTGQGEQWEGPAWILVNEYVDRLGVELELVPVSHETKVPVVQSGQVDMTIAPLSATEQRKQVVDFVVYSNSSICMFGRADNRSYRT